jgi:hypothetical protein
VADDSYQQEMARKDDYDQPQSLLFSLIENIPYDNIQQVWKVTRHRGQKSEPQHVILLNDGSHLCTCLWLINRGIVCRHFFRVMSYSINAQFHISLIPQWWYNNKYNIEYNDKENIAPIYHIGESELHELEQPLPQLSFQHLTNFRWTSSNVVQLQGPKQKYGFGMGYAKKALDLAIRTNKVDELVNQVKCFIENTKAELSKQQENMISMHIGDPLRIQHKGRQPNRYRSCGELQKKKTKHVQNVTNITNYEEKANQNSKKRERRCKKCNQVGHYVPRCPNI